MKKILNLLVEILAEIGRVRAAAALARSGRYNLAKQLISD